MPPAPSAACLSASRSSSRSASAAAAPPLSAVAPPVVVEAVVPLLVVEEKGAVLVVVVEEAEGVARAVCALEAEGGELAVGHGDVGDACVGEVDATEYIILISVSNSFSLLVLFDTLSLLCHFSTLTGSSISFKKFNVR